MKSILLTTAFARVAAAFSGTPKVMVNAASDTIKRVTGTEDLVINASSGQMRAARRLREHKEIWVNTPVSTTISRQRRRREAILRERQFMTVATAEALGRGIMGGSAVLRNRLDVEEKFG